MHQIYAGIDHSRFESGCGDSGRGFVLVVLKPRFPRLTSQRIFKNLTTSLQTSDHLKLIMGKPWLTARLLTKGRKIGINISRQKQQLMTDNSMAFPTPLRKKFSRKIFLTLDISYFYNNRQAFLQRTCAP